MRQYSLGHGGLLSIDTTADTTQSAFQVATFYPSSSLAKGLYRATLTTGVKDKAGNALANDHTWSFATVGPTKK